MYVFFYLVIRRPPRSTRTDTLFPYTTLFRSKGASSGFMMEMPKYQWPRAPDVLIGLYQRAWIFLRRAGTIILFSTLILWALLSFPKPPAGSDISEVNYSVAGRIANTITTAFEPTGFNRDITLALIPADRKNTRLNS